MDKRIRELETELDEQGYLSYKAECATLALKKMRQALPVWPGDGQEVAPSPGQQIDEDRNEDSERSSNSFSSIFDPSRLPSLGQSIGDSVKSTFDRIKYVPGSNRAPRVIRMALSQ